MKNRFEYAFIKMQVRRSVIWAFFLSAHFTPIAAKSSEATMPPSLEKPETPIWIDSMMGQIGAQVLAESALMDKETGRIFWEGSKSSITASISPFLDDLGITLTKATLLNAALIFCLISILAKIIREPIADNGISSRVAALASVLGWTLSRVPELHPTLIGAIILLYLIEAYFCNTRQYLTNSMASGEDFEDYIEQLRESQPVVTWKVRCFHYERRLWAKLFLPNLLVQNFRRFQNEEKEEDDYSTFLSPAIWNKKVITHKAKATYQFKSCVDSTIAGVWKRSLSSPQFTKIILSQLLILANEKAREDYIRQQANFVSIEGSADQLAEFSTSFEIEGFRPKLLAVRKHPSKFFRLDLFWAFTLLGLSLPYRLWLKQKCDILRVTVTKETSADEIKQKKVWFKSQKEEEESTFRNVMQNLQLYARQEENDSSMTAGLLHDVQAARENYAEKGEDAI